MADTSEPIVGSPESSTTQPSVSEPGSTLYQPLDPARREIRLLRIVGGSDDGPIECSFRTVSLDDDMAFTALSYVWGDAAITKEVLLDGHRRAVTTNLESALRNFWRYSKAKGDSAMVRSFVRDKQVEEEGCMALLGRMLAPLRRGFTSDSSSLHHESNVEAESSAGREREVDDGEDSTGDSETDDDDSNTDKSAWVDTLTSARIKSSYLRALVGMSSATIWVDALCINQNDLAEKSHQIMLMRDIYAKAECVFSWLGEPDEGNMDQALRIVRTIAPHLSKGRAGPKFEWLRQYPELWDCTVSNQGWGAISSFEGAGYFQRLWIFQEMWAARFAVFICGDEYLPMSTFQAYQDWAGSIQDEGEDAVPDFMELGAWYRMRLSFLQPGRGAVPVVRQVQQISITSANRVRILLRVARGWDCTDPRDKVFALLGVLRMDIPVDYTMSVAEVYSRWAASPYFDISRASLLVFSGVGLYPRAEGIPSWLPDLYNLGRQLPDWDGSSRYAYAFSKVPEWCQPSVGLDGTFRCFGSQITKVTEVLIPSDRTPDGRGGGGPGPLNLDLTSIAVHDTMLRALRYFISNRHQLWGGSPTNAKASHLWMLVQAMTGFLPGNLSATPGDLGELSLENLFKIIRRRMGRDGDAMYEFSTHELDILGFRSRAEVLDCLSDVPAGRGYHTWSSDSKPAGGLLDNFYVSLLYITLDKCVFQTVDGLVGVGPPGTEAGDLVYLVVGLCLPVLLRVVRGKLLNVGACSIYGMLGADAVRILSERIRDVREIMIE